MFDRPEPATQGPVRHQEDKRVQSGIEPEVVRREPATVDAAFALDAEMDARSAEFNAIYAGNKKEAAAMSVAELLRFMKESTNIDTIKAIKRNRSERFKNENPETAKLFHVRRTDEQLQDDIKVNEQRMAEGDLETLEEEIGYKELFRVVRAELRKRATATWEKLKLAQAKNEGIQLSAEEMTLLNVYMEPALRGSMFNDSLESTPEHTNEDRQH